MDMTIIKVILAKKASQTMTEWTHADKTSSDTVMRWELTLDARLDTDDDMSFTILPSFT